MNSLSHSNTSNFESSPLRVIERRSAPLKIDDKVLPMFQLRDFDAQEFCQQSPLRQEQQFHNQSFTTSYLSLSFFDIGEEQDGSKAPLDKVGLQAVHNARSLLDSFRKNTMYASNDSTASISIEDF